MTRRSDFYIREIIITLLILLGPAISLFSQEKEISGIVNVYRKVVAIGTAPKDNVTLASVDSVAAGDTILLIQMQGFEIQTTNGSYGALLLNKLGSPGRYEFLLVNNVDIIAKKVYFTRFIQNDFDVRGNVQLIVVPYYDRARVSGKLTSKSWNSASGTGGVLAMIVGSRLEFDNTSGEIDVSGKGFRGGLDATGIGECVDTYPNSLFDSYPATWMNAGFKGEGVAIHDIAGTLLAPLHVKGKGPNFTGGGGGNGKYSGGGGGSNRGVGADGSQEKSFGIGSCLSPVPGGLGGNTNTSNEFTDGVFPGSGGGASTYSAGGPISNGGNGGGIVIILADTISGNSRSIKAAGLSASNVTGDRGGGGGGAGGSVLLSMRSFTNNPSDLLTISVRGGNGGSHPDGWGSGGGGGAGLISISLAAYPVNVLVDTVYGTPAPIDFGWLKLENNLVPKINGFLFNAIRSEITGNQKDSICSNVPFGKIIGTEPVGGEPPYSIHWEKSTVSENSGFTIISGANTRDYTPGLLSQTTWFRRVVTDSSTPVITDVSIPVKVTVHQAITGNLVGKDTTICFGQNPLPLEPLNSGPSNGNGRYSYKWLQNLNNTVWDTTMAATGTIIRSAGYDPPVLTTTTYYKRFVQSGRCIDYSPRVTITVLPSITGNITNRPDSVICEGSLFNTLGASAAGGGELTYKYQWQDSISTSVWVPAAGLNTGTTYEPDTSTFSVIENRYLRRVVFSGPDSVCRDNSSPIYLTRYHKIKNNSIVSEPVRCSPGSGIVFSGSTPTQGKSGEYTYQWQESLDGNTTWNTMSTNGPSFTALQPEIAMHYRRIVNSSKCTDISEKVLAHRQPVAVPGTSADICGPQITLTATPSVGTGTWIYPAAVVQATPPGNPVVTVKVDSVANAGKNQTHKFWWREINGICKDSSSVDITFYKRIKNIDAGPDTSFYTFDYVIHMVADPTESWEEGIWTLVSGSGIPADDNDNMTTIENLAAGVNIFNWRVTNKNVSKEICWDEDEVAITVYDIFVPEGFSPNHDAGNYNNNFVITGLDLENQVAELSIVNGAGAEVFSTSNQNGNLWTDWDGTNSKGAAVPEGTYYYMLKLTSKLKAGSVYKKSGFVILKRY